MAAPAQIALRRHFHEMSEKDADAVVQTVADLIVSYLKRNSESLRRATATPAASGPNPPTATVAQVRETHA